jgi:hypothetical protein
MKFLFYILGAFFCLVGFMDGPHFIPLLIGFTLLTIAYNADKFMKDINSKKASKQLLTLAELKEKGVITQDEYDLKSSELKDKL